MLERCPEMFRRRYLLGLKESPSASLLWGTVDGKAHGVNFAQKIDSHEDLPVGEVQEAFASLMDAEVESYGGASEVDWRDDELGSIKDRGVALVGAYHKQVSPRVQPTAIEEKFSLDIPGSPVPFIGYIDVSTEPTSIERKTAAQKSSSIPPQYQLQVLGYALARSRPVEVHISTRTKTPAVYTPVEEKGLLLGYQDSLSRRAERIIGVRVRQLLSLYDEFGPDEAWPDAIGSQAWHASLCQMCGWGPTGSNDCQWWQS